MCCSSYRTPCSTCAFHEWWDINTVYSGFLSSKAINVFTSSSSHSTQKKLTKSLKIQWDLQCMKTYDKAFYFILQMQIRILVQYEKSCFNVQWVGWEIAFFSEAHLFRWLSTWLQILLFLLAFSSGVSFTCPREPMLALSHLQVLTRQCILQKESPAHVPWETSLDSPRALRRESLTRPLGLLPSPSARRQGSPTTRPRGLPPQYGTWQVTNEWRTGRRNDPSHCVKSIHIKGSEGTQNNGKNVASAIRWAHMSASTSTSLGFTKRR